MASRRSKSSGCEDRPKRRPKDVKHESVLTLKASYQNENFSRKTISPMFLDLRGRNYGLFIHLGRLGEAGK